MGATLPALGWNKLWPTNLEVMEGWLYLFLAPLFKGLSGSLPLRCPSPLQPTDKIALQRWEVLHETQLSGTQAELEELRTEGTQSSREPVGRGQLYLRPQNKEGRRGRRHPLPGGPCHLAEESGRPYCKGGIFFDDRQCGRVEQIWALESDRQNLNPAIC